MDEPITQNPYKTLGVPKDATLATIRSAHRKLVLSCHPDKVQEESAKQRAGEQFHLVQQAYEVLSDDHRRQRYDERTKLAELRAEMMDERIPLRRAATYSAPRPDPYAPNIEVRGNRVYEERVPKSSRAYQEDVFAQSFAEARPSVKKFDDMYAEPRSSRRTSGRGQEERMRPREAETERERRAREADRKKKTFAERDRERTKDKRRDVEAKSRGKMQYMEDDLSDSDAEDLYYSSRRDREREPEYSKRRYEEVRRKDRDELKRSSKSDGRSRGYPDEDVDKEREAMDYISRSREAMSDIYIDPPRSRPSKPRGDSHLDRNSPVERMPPAPPPAPARPTETQRRSSERDRSDKERSGGEKDRRRGGRSSRQVSPVRVSSSKKDKQYEIVDPPSSRKPSMPTSSSGSKGIKGLFSSSSGRKEPQRSATHQPASDFKHPGMRRSETMPIHQMRRNDPIPLKSSTLRNQAPSELSTSDDDSSSEDSDETPEARPRMSHSQTKYKVQHDDIESPRTVFMEPEEFVHRPRDSSPPRATRRASDRPPLAPRGSTTRAPPVRGASFADASERPSMRRGESARMPPFSTQTSGRSKDHLFGAVDEDISPLGGKYRVSSSPKVSSPKMSPADIRYSSNPRRKAAEDFDRDAYPGSMNKGHRRPSYARGESVY